MNNGRLLRGDAKDAFHKGEVVATKLIAEFAVRAGTGITSPSGANIATSLRGSTALIAATHAPTGVIPGVVAIERTLTANAHTCRAVVARLLTFPPADAASVGTFSVPAQVTFIAALTAIIGIAIDVDA